MRLTKRMFTNLKWARTKWQHFLNETEMPLNHMWFQTEQYVRLAHSMRCQFWTCAYVWFWVCLFHFIRNIFCHCRYFESSISFMHSSILVESFGCVQFVLRRNHCCRCHDYRLCYCFRRHRCLNWSLWNAHTKSTSINKRTIHILRLLRECGAHIFSYFRCWYFFISFICRLFSVIHF